MSDTLLILSDSERELALQGLHMLQVRNEQAQRRLLELDNQGMLEVAMAEALVQITNELGHIGLLIERLTSKEGQ